MKKLPLLLTLLLLTISCQFDEPINPEKGFIQFSFPGHSGGRGEGTAEPVAVLLSLEDADGNAIEQSKKLLLYSFGSGYVSEGLQLSAGNYKLTKFMVLDANNNVIYATPVEGSSLAYLVDDPLPIAFTVTENGTTLVTPQVLAITDENTPENFGYVNFGFEVVTPQPARLREIWLDEFANVQYKIFLTYNGDLLKKQTTYYYYAGVGQLLDSVVFQHNSMGKVSNKTYYYVFGFQPGQQPSPETTMFEYFDNGNLKKMITIGFSGSNNHQFDFFYDADGKLTSAHQKFYPSLQMRHQIKYEVNYEGEITNAKNFNANGTLLMSEIRYTYHNSLNPFPFDFEYDPNRLFMKHNIATQQTIGYNMTGDGLIESYSCQYSMVYKITNNRVTKVKFFNPDYCYETYADQSQYTFIYN